jgi:hypothetical protein
MSQRTDNVRRTLTGGFSLALGLARYTVGLRAYCRRQISLREAESIIRQGMKSRGARFMLMLERSILGYKPSPYRQLLKAAGCELGDVQRMVASDGVEGTLERLHRVGVYVTYEEFKGRAIAVRGSQTFQFDDADFDNPLVRGEYAGSTGGSGGRPTRIKIDLEFLEQMVPHWAVWFDIHGVLRQPLVFVHPIYPTAMAHHLMALKFGNRAVKWFATAKGRDGGYRLAAASVHGITQKIAKLHGPDSDSSPARVAAYLGALAAAGHRPGVNVPPSMAARIGLAAKDAGVSLQGVTFLLGAEPLTMARKQSIESSGARATVTYGFSEGGNVGNQCDHPVAPDDIHVSLDTYAAIHDPLATHAEQHSHPLFLTTFRSATPKVLLNTEVGDAAVLETRPCDCRFSELGYTQHVHTVRSVRKLTGDGVTFHDADIITALDALAQAFGGGPADYQVIEQQSAAGLPRYSLVVSTRVGPLNEAVVVEKFLSQLGKVRPVNGFMVNQWAQLGVVRVERREPVLGLRGKVLPYQTLQQA